MNTLNLQVVNPYQNNAFIMLDGEIVKLKKSKRGRYEYSYQTKKSSVSVTLYQYSPLLTTFWFFTELFYFIISVFGVFDGYRSKKGLTVSLNAEIQLEENTDCLIRLLNAKVDSPCAVIETANVNVIENTCFINEKINKRRKALILPKLIIIAISVALLFSILF